MSAAAQAPAVELANVGFRYRQSPAAARSALECIDLQVTAGTICGLIGPNGSGKSTTLKVAAGLLEPTTGRAAVHGLPPSSCAARSLTGYLPESPDFPPWQTVDEFLSYCGRLSGLDGDRLDRGMESAKSKTMLRALGGRRTSALSKGERQRLGLAQAVLHDPSVLILDEPASGLDPIGVAGLTRLLLELRSEGRTILVCSHFLPQLEEVCDRVLLFCEGRVIWAGPPQRGGHLEAVFIRNALAHARAG